MSHNFDVVPSLYALKVEKSRLVHIFVGSGVAQYSVWLRTGQWGIGVQFLAGPTDFSSSLCVQTGSEAQPASCTMGTGGPFPGAKRSWGVTLTTHPQPSAKVGNE
jgi:hypothetical protein